MIIDLSSLLDDIESQESGELMNPFLSDVTRSTNVRVYSPMSRIEPYSTK